MMHCTGSEPSGNLLGIVISVGKQGRKKKVYVYFHFLCVCACACVCVCTHIHKTVQSEYWLCHMSVHPHGTAPRLPFSRFS